MADTATVNGGDRTVEISGKDDLDTKKVESVEENKGLKERVAKLSEEIRVLESEKAGMKREIEEYAGDMRALESIAKRAAELETEVSRLQHDLITAANDGEEAKVEVLELRRVVEEVRKSDSEKETKVDALEKERNLLLEKVGREAEMEDRIRTMEARERAQNEERIQIEGELKTMIEARETEIRQLKKWVEDLDSKGLKSGLEIEKLRKEKEELQIMKNELEAVLKKSDRRTKEMESRIAELERELEAAEQKAVDRVNGEAAVLVGAEKALIGDDGEKGSMGLFIKQQWPVVAASSGAIAAVAVMCYLRYGRQR